MPHGQQARGGLVVVSARCRCSLPVAWARADPSERAADALGGGRLVPELLHVMTDAMDVVSTSNPIAGHKTVSSDNKVDAFLTSFEDETKSGAVSPGGGAFESEEASGKAPKPMMTSRNQYADHGAGNQKGGKGLCCAVLTCSFKKKGKDLHSQGNMTDSIIEFDPIELADPLHPHLLDSQGFELSCETDRGHKVDIADVPEIDDGVSNVEDIGHLAILEVELQVCHEQIHKAFDPRNPQGNSLKNAPLLKLHNQAEDLERRMEAEQARLKAEDDEAHRIAEEAVKKRQSERTDDGMAALNRFRSAGKKTLLGVRAVGAIAASVTHVSIDDPDLSLGVDWHFQNSRAVIAAVRDGGSAAKYMDGKVLRPGMVLKSFGLGRGDTEVNYSWAKKEMDKYPAGFTMTAGHVVAVVLDHSRPMTMEFEKPGFDLTPEDEKAGKKLTIEQTEIGFALQDLKYLIPKTPQKLGARFWKTRTGVVLCDIESDSILANDDYILEGMRPGLRLKEIVSADGYTRKMDNADLSYTQIMRQVAISQRPCVYVFDPIAKPFEFTFEPNMLPTTRKDKDWIKKRTINPGSGEPLPFSIFRELGLSLKEEETSSWGSHNFRCRITGILPGGVIDRFNREHEHAWVTPGMTISTLFSPMYHITDVRGKSLEEVTSIFHKCAPGTPITKQQTGKDGRKREWTLDGKSITIGFEVTLRALKEREVEAIAHGGHRGEVQHANVDMKEFEVA